MRRPGRHAKTEHMRSYALKILQSEGELTIASTGKDPVTGKLVTHEYHVEGPVMIFLTTTAIDVDEELQNRCLVLTVDEARDKRYKEQSAAIPLGYAGTAKNIADLASFLVSSGSDYLTGQAFNVTGGFLTS